MYSSKKQNLLFDVKVIPPHQFHLISPLTLFTMGQRREAIVYDSSFIEGEQVNLLVKPKNSSSIAGAAALQVFPSQIAIVDFYILEHYRHRGAGRILMKAIESLAIRRGIRKINTGRSLHSDNREMIEFHKRVNANLTIAAIPVDGYQAISLGILKLNENRKILSITEKPKIEITNPANGSYVSGNVSLTIVASDNVSVDTVILYIDGAQKKTWS